MRQLEASIKTFNLDRVKVALWHLGVTRFDIRAATAAFQRRDFLPRVTVHVTVPELVADQVVELLAGAS